MWQSRCGDAGDAKDAGMLRCLGCGDAECWPTPPVTNADTHTHPFGSYLTPPLVDFDSNDLNKYGATIQVHRTCLYMYIYIYIYLNAPPTPPTRTSAAMVRSAPVSPRSPRSATQSRGLARKATASVQVPAIKRPPQPSRGAGGGGETAFLGSFDFPSTPKTLKEDARFQQLQL